MPGSTPYPVKRVVFRYSIFQDTSSTVKNYVGRILTDGGLAPNAGTYEATGDPLKQEAIQAASKAVTILANPKAVPGANPNAHTEFVWLYID